MVELDQGILEKESLESINRDLNELHGKEEELKSNYQKQVDNMNLIWEKLFSIFLPYI